MELDDLKEKWKATGVSSSSVDFRETLEKKVSALRTSGRGIKRVFYFELALAAVTYIFMFGLIWYVGERMMTYMYTIMIITTLGSIPVIWRLYKSQQWINSMDHSQDMRSNVVSFLRYYKTTLRIYQWSCYVVIGICIAAMFLDADFMALTLKLKLSVIGYMVMVALLAPPYIRFVYGRRASAFEDFLRD